MHNTLDNECSDGYAARESKDPDFWRYIMLQKSGSSRSAGKRPLHCSAAICSGKFVLS